MSKIINLEYLVSSDSIAVHFEKPEELPEDFKYQILLDNKLVEEADKTHFLLENLPGDNCYDVQVKIISEAKEWAASEILQLRTKATKRHLDVTKAPYLAGA